ncbi:hypothetical protein [Streptomyces sp. YIM B13518]|uniref:hypothetical protein n=1 Tax=Streptomyces sp. YIM B13518 TaxID=3366316 RepID=UPI003683347C
MGHVESAHLLELALGHASGDEDAGALRHISTCPRCREELELTTRVLTAARNAEAADLVAVPPERVWQGIVRELSYQAATPSQPGERPVRRSAAETAGAGTRAGLLALALVVGVALLRRFRTRAGRGPVRRLRSPRWRRACRARPG